MYFPFWPNFPQYNNCSPSSLLPKFVEIVVFAVVFKEKNSKKKKEKKAGDLKILLANISTMGALHSMIETDFGSCSAGLPFSFFSQVM